MPREFDLAKQWLTKAQNDLLNADNNLAARKESPLFFAPWRLNFNRIVQEVGYEMS